MVLLFILMGVLIVVLFSLLVVLIRLLADQLVPIVSDVFSIDECATAFKHMEEGKQAGKIVFDLQL
jgi:D-arabinose 1-dehydrogenase-like Zn-dependent alcohol dehydrogenase